MDKQFSKKIISLAGNDGKAWLVNLPNLVKHYEEKWQLECFEPFPLSYNYVLPAKTKSGKPVVLKIGFPNNHAFIHEINALKLYASIGAIKVIQEDLVNQAVLLERAVPGTRIGDILPDSKQISLVSEVIKKIHQPIPLQSVFNFPTLSDWAKAFEKYRRNYDITTGPIPVRMFEEAEETFSQYDGDERTSVLLHGDLHNDNILLSERGWLTIDPKGVIGNQEYEVGTYLRNPLTDLPENSNFKSMVKNRVLQFSDELGLDRKNILNWTFANAVISLLWFLEDEGELNQTYLGNAELISEIQL
ncbi:MAG: hypothetical protein O2840_00505 [bacterium]|nr:hypothetical protein [bacterium]